MFRSINLMSSGLQIMWKVTQFVSLTQTTKLGWLIKSRSSAVAQTICYDQLIERSTSDIWETRQLARFSSPCVDITSGKVCTKSGLMDNIGSSSKLFTSNTKPGFTETICCLIRKADIDLRTNSWLIALKTSMSIIYQSVWTCITLVLAQTLLYELSPKSSKYVLLVTLFVQISKSSN